MIDESEFDDIRPYRDHEIGPKIRKFYANPWLLKKARQAAVPWLPERFHGLFVRLFNVIRRLVVGRIDTVYDFQKKLIVDQVLERIISGSSDGLTYSGLDDLERDLGYLYISNHRDISLDPALINYLLFRHGHVPSEIGFGDNLMYNETVTDLIRINRSYIVKRALTPREQLMASIQLSKYIWHSYGLGHSLWIAQREGRAKDGNDFTNPSILKMIRLSRKSPSFGYEELLQELRIVPVAISYEYDPCDRMKAWESYRREHKGGHEKGAHEDLASIFAGIKGYKGRIHIHFGKPLVGPVKNEKDVAALIDDSIHENYRLFPSHYIAYDLANDSRTYSDQYTEDQRTAFLARYKSLPPKVVPYVLAQYANPVKNRESR